MAANRQRKSGGDTSANAPTDRTLKRASMHGLTIAVLALVWFASAAWAMLYGSVFYSVAVIALDFDNYRPAQFVVQSVVYQVAKKTAIRRITQLAWLMVGTRNSLA